MCAVVVLGVAAACPHPAPPAAAGPVPGTGHQPRDWADTRILAASAGEPPPEDSGLVKVSVPKPAA
jgi:hypothetical protein